MIDTKSIEKNFYSQNFINEDDVKLQSYANIFKVILDEVNPSSSKEFKSEHTYLHGGRSDALYRNISIEYKAFKYFQKQKYIDEALYGRNEKDSGLYQYILNSSNLNLKDSNEEMCNKIEKNIGVGFDGETFIFCRFVRTVDNHEIDFSKSKLETNEILDLKLKFQYTKVNFREGLNQLILLLKQQHKIALNKTNLQTYINPKVPEVRADIKKLYYLLLDDLGKSGKNLPINTRVQTLFLEWESVFGILYGAEEDITDFNRVIPPVKTMYMIDDKENIDIRVYLFAMQTYFNILLKLLVNSFIKSLINPSFTEANYYDHTEIIDLFEGRNEDQQRYVHNFFEIHYYEWFTYSTQFDVNIINSILEIINKFDFSSFILKPEVMQDIFQEVYMGLIPQNLRKIMGEYFSPDWIVEFSLNRLGYKGDINKRIVDPACGSGAFLIQAIKRLKENNEISDFKSLETITNNVVGFDINPISAVSAKANYIISLLSSIFNKLDTVLEKPISIPIYIADSVLAPVVYSEQNKNSVSAKTHLGEFEIPKFKSYQEASLFLDILSNSINKEESSKVFNARIKSQKFDFDSDKEQIAMNLFDFLYKLHRGGQDSFWGKILKNSFAPIMINQKFDYVCGNPPWISWKTMSKTYREGTGEVWRSYGIFEKDNYDKITTHDDFGMAVTYVAIDQYLKQDGKMVFILPTSFLKSAKGGHGFRKFNITRNKQNIPFSIESIDNFTPQMVFTINSSVIVFNKGKKMIYPFLNYNNWSFKDKLLKKEKKLNPHDNWKDVRFKLNCEQLVAQPINRQDTQSQWLTIKNSTEFMDSALDVKGESNYRGRKGIEPLGAKGVFVLTDVRKEENLLNVTTDFSRQRRKDILEKGPIQRNIEEEFVYPMIGGRNMERWLVRNYTFLLLPHTQDYKYGIPEEKLVEIAPLTFDFLTHYKKEVLATRIQNGKRFDKDKHPFYRLDNVGIYTFSPYKVIWKEQTKSMAAVVISSFNDIKSFEDDKLFSGDKLVMLDSKVLYLSLDTKEEAHYVCGLLNSKSIREILDGYAIETNRGIDVLKFINIPKYDRNNELHNQIARTSMELHEIAKNGNESKLEVKECELDSLVKKLYLK